MIIIQGSTDVEVYSSNSAGGFQGHGYLVRNTGFVAPSLLCRLCMLTSYLHHSPRFLRMVDVTSFSVHDLIFTDCELIKNP